MREDSVSILLRSPEYSDVPALKLLWSSVFGDDDEYIDAFFARWFKPEMAVCGYMGGTVIAMGFLLDYGVLRTELCDYRCAMIYGVAVSPDHRSHGVGSSIVLRLMENAHKIGFTSTVLHPAHKGLYPFYEALGQKAAFSAQHYVLDADRFGTEDGCTLHEVSPSVYGVLRERYAGLPRIDISDDALEWYAEMGGRLYSLSIGNKEFGCAAAELQGGNLLVKELLCPESEMESSARALLQIAGARRAVISVPSSDGEPFGTSDVPLENPGWLGLAFD